MLEVTLDQTDEAKANDGICSMERIKKSFGDRVCLGAGTVISVEQVKRVVAAAVLAPLNHIPVLAMGGVTLTNIKEFIKSGVKGVGLGGNLVDKQAILSGDYAKIRETAWSYVNVLKE